MDMDCINTEISLDFCISSKWADDNFMGSSGSDFLQICEVVQPRLDEIAETADRKTTSLSANLLNSASKGEFSESWHQLVKGIFSQDTKTAQDAIFNFAQIGAFSGRDSLAGFATHLLRSRFSAKNRAISK